MSVLGSMDRVLWGTHAKARLVNSNQKERGFAKLHSGLIQGVPKERLWEAEETVAHKG